MEDHFLACEKLIFYAIQIMGDDILDDILSIREVSNDVQSTRKRFRCDDNEVEYPLADIDDSIGFQVDDFVIKESDRWNAEMRRTLAALKRGDCACGSLISAVNAQKGVIISVGAMMSNVRARLATAEVTLHGIRGVQVSSYSNLTAEISQLKVRLADLGKRYYEAQVAKLASEVALRRYVDENIRPEAVRITAEKCKYI